MFHQKLPAFTWRVACGWNGQSLVEARESGIRLDSIQSVLNALRGESAQSAKNTDDVVKLKRAEIRKEFAEKLGSLDDDELNVLSLEFEYMWGMVYEALRPVVCRELECDYYGEQAEIKLILRERRERRLGEPI